MKLFIGNIPGEATIMDLYEFVGGLELQARFIPYTGIDHSDKNYHFVVAQLSREQDIDSLIDRYNGIEFKGRPLQVRRYYERQKSNGWDGPERRVNVH